MKFSLMVDGVSIEALLNKLGGVDGARRFLSDEVVTAANPRIFLLRKTIKIGTGLKTAKDFRIAIRRLRGNLNDWASGMLDQPAFTISETETDIDLGVVSVAELGFKHGAARADIYARALDRCLFLCSAEVGPQLRRQYIDQPKGESLLVAMEPILLDRVHNVFCVTHNSSGLWLVGSPGNPDDFFSSRTLWVFRRSK